MEKRMQLVLIIGVAIIVLGTIAWSFLFTRGDTPGGAVYQETDGVAGDPIDIASDFYSEWITIRQSTSSGLYSEQLAERVVLGTALKEKLVGKVDSINDGALDPVLCQVTVPSGVRAKTVYENEGSMQLLVFAKDEGVVGQASVTLQEASEGMWYISDIACSSGEQAVEQGEFSFDQKGALLKEHIPPPRDPSYWYLVFAQNDIEGFTAPLLFTENSTCVREDRIETACSDDQFYETMRVHVQGHLTETGVDVVKLEAIE